MLEDKPLSAAELAGLKAKAKAATPGPYFAAEDEAFDCPDHRKSGLALVDTGRREDWPIARLCEWNQAYFTVAANPETILRLIDMIERRDAWQPIETAPKDGTPILAYVAKWSCYEAVFWRGVAWALAIKLDGFIDVPEPTHWQPLPAPLSDVLAATEPPDA